jgi:predicted alpha/beta hydrolase
MIDERVSFNSGPYKLAGHFFSPDCSMSALPGIIYCGGFPGGQAGLSIASALSKDGYSVLKFDYRGMRESEGYCILDPRLTT